MPTYSLAEEPLVVTVHIYCVITFCNHERYLVAWIYSPGMEKRAVQSYLLPVAP